MKRRKKKFGTPKTRDFEAMRNRQHPKQFVFPSAVRKPNPMPATKLYLAYGSNLHKAQMRLRCPDAQPVGTLLVHDARLVFRGVADLEFCPGAAVPIGLWHISESDERALDRYEGISSGLYFKATLDTNDGREGLVYLMTSDGIAPPCDGYLNTIREGYRNFGLPLDALEAARKDSWERKNHDKQTLWRHDKWKREGKALARMPMSIVAKRHALVEEMERKWEASHVDLGPPLGEWRLPR